MPLLCMCFVPLTQRVRSFVAVEAGAAAETPKGPSEGLSQWLTDKESACKAGVTGDAGTIPGSGRFPGGGNGNPLQYSCLENLMDRGA